MRERSFFSKLYADWPLQVVAAKWFGPLFYVLPADRGIGGRRGLEVVLISEGLESELRRSSLSNGLAGLPQEQTYLTVLRSQLCLAGNPIDPERETE